MSRFRVIVTDLGSTRGPSEVRAVIDDARDIGGSEYANDGGEFFMTLPWNHPQISAIVPLERHYEVRRQVQDGSYQTVFRGLIDDFRATKNEVVVYGRDWLSLLDTSITPNGTSYTNTFVGTIIQQQITAAIAETNSRVGFISAGTIATTSTTATVISNFQSRLQFIADLADIAIGSSTNRAIIRVEPKSSSTPSFTFTENLGSNQLGIALTFGGLVNDFDYAPGYGDIVTTIKAIGQKREGATILYSTQSYASPATYGYIARPELFLDVSDQTALDRLALRSARISSRIGQGVALRLRVNRLGPDEGYAIGDSVLVTIQRGLVSVVSQLYTVWGYEWIGKKNGSEDLFLSLLPQDT